MAAPPLMAGRDLLRNPWLWSAVAGMAIVTLLRPVLRRDPPLPPVTGTLPAYELTDASGRRTHSTDLAGRPYVLALVDPACGECGRLHAALEELDARLRAEQLAVPVVAVSIGSAGPLGEGERALSASAASSQEQACELARAAFERPAGGPLPCDRLGDVVRASRLVLVDRRGQARGTYATDRLGVDETFHRATHLLHRDAP